MFSDSSAAINDNKITFDSDSDLYKSSNVYSATPTNLYSSPYPTQSSSQVTPHYSQSPNQYSPNSQSTSNQYSPNSQSNNQYSSNSQSNNQYSSNSNHQNSPNSNYQNSFFANSPSSNHQNSISNHQSSQTPSLYSEYTPRSTTYRPSTRSTVNIPFLPTVPAPDFTESPRPPATRIRTIQTSTVGLEPEDSVETVKSTRSNDDSWVRKTVPSAGNQYSTSSTRYPTYSTPELTEEEFPASSVNR